MGGVADGSDETAGRGLGTDAIDGGEQAAHLMFAVQFAVEVAVEIAQAATQGVEVIAGVADLQAIEWRCDVVRRSVARPR